VLRELEDPAVWSNPERAQELGRERTRLEAVVGTLDRLSAGLSEAGELLELAEAESDEGTVRSLETDVTRLEGEIARLEFQRMFPGEMDSHNCFLDIQAGAGGTEAQDWAQMLMRMYLRWAERHGYATEVFDISYAEEAGIKSATFQVKTPYAYGTLGVEQGTHRLVRISPFDNQGRRQTSFAAVEVLPVTEQTDHVEIPENEIRIDVFRSSGPGGQSVNTTDSAVRITHLPTGIVVSCQNEKSQIQNRAAAMRVLEARLLERRRQEERAQLDALKGDTPGSWGNQMRSYVLHPYQMVKDLRTEHETGNTAAVLDGEIEAFIDAGIRWRRGSAAS